MKDAVRLADGRLVLMGPSGGTEPVPSKIGRIRADGILDTSFGTNGFTTFHFADGHNTYPETLALDSSGALIAVGQAREQVTIFQRVGIAQFTPDGFLDPSFSADGRMTLDLGSQKATARAGVPLPGGRTLLSMARIIPIPTGETTDFEVRMVEADGSPVATFGSSGLLQLDLGATLDYEYELAALDPDSRILVFGAGFDGTNTAAIFARFDLDGNPDVVFNDGPYRKYIDPGHDLQPRYRLAFDAEERILACGLSQVSGAENELFVIRVWP